MFFIKFSSFKISDSFLEMSSSKTTEEDHHIILEFDADVDISTLTPGTVLDIQNMKSGKPIIKTKDSVYVGEARDAFGTSMIFQKDQQSSKHELLGSSTKNVRIRKCFKRSSGNGGSD